MKHHIRCPVTPLPDKELNFKELPRLPLNSLHPERPTMDDESERLQTPENNPATRRRRSGHTTKVRCAWTGGNRKTNARKQLTGDDGSSAAVSGARAQEEELRSHFTDASCREESPPPSERCALPSAPLLTEIASKAGPT